MRFLATQICLIKLRTLPCTMFGAACLWTFAQEHLCALVRPADQGLLCFRHRSRLYHSLILDHGARASGFYWSRVSGLMVRLLHRLLHFAHSSLIYVDDPSTLLERSSAPVWACLLTLAILVLEIPMSWHKAHLSTQVVWIS